jgi:plastocyanin
MNRYELGVVACAIALAACKQDATATPTSTPQPVASTPPPTRAAAAAPSAAPAAPFEGEIVLSVKDEGPMKMPSSVTVEVKGDKVRYSATSSGVHTVADMAAQRGFAVNDARKSYSSLDVHAAASAPPAATVTKTPWSETVSGVPCDVWLIDDGKEKVEACAAKGIAFFDPARESKAGKAEPSWAAALTREKAFPLRVTAHDEAGKEEYRAEATKVERRKLDDSVFQVPTGFKQGDVSADVKTASLP